MGAEPLATAEFFRELGLLAKSGLPLPESIRQLGVQTSRRGFGGVLQRLGEDTAAGLPLAQAMARHPGWFSPFHVRLVAAGEKAGTLPEVLEELGRWGRQQRLLLAQLREIMAYPLFTMWFALVVLGFVLCMVMPIVEEVMGDFYHDFLAPVQMVVTHLGNGCDPQLPLAPLALRVLCLLSHGVLAVWPYLVVVAVALPLFGLWLYWGGRRAEAVWSRLLAALPGFRLVARDADYARLCLLLGLCLRQGVPLPEALHECAALVASSRLARMLRRWAELNAAGTAFADAVAREPQVDGLLALAVRRCPEAALPGELRELSELYEERATARRTMLLAQWELLLCLFLVTTVGSIIVAIFLGFRGFLELLGG